MAVYLLFGYRRELDNLAYRVILLIICAGVAFGQSQMSDESMLPWVAFVAVVLFAVAWFYRFIAGATKPGISVTTLWLVSLQFFLWLDFLMADDLSVVPSVIMIGVGFGIISFGFRRRRNAERISGLVMVIICTLKAISFDVWFAAPPVRVAALFVGAGICIAVSRLYAKQSEAIKEMSRGLDKIVESVHSNSATSQEASAMSDQLKNQSGELNDMIRKFNLKK
jgi:hypothetical protein